jgi:hypothetical protein
MNLSFFQNGFCERHMQMLEAPAYLKTYLEYVYDKDSLFKKTENQLETVPGDFLETFSLGLSGPEMDMPAGKR